MTFVCLAAGKGTRFARLSRYLQKCMYPIGIAPFVEYSVAHLVSSQSIDIRNDRLVFVVGHHAGQLVDYFGDSYAGLPIQYVEQHEQLGTGHAVECARQAIGFDEAVVWLADLFVSSTMFDSMRRHAEDSVLTIATDEDEENDNVRVDIDAARVLRAWQGSSDYFDIGLWKLGTSVLDRIAAMKGDEIRVLLNVQAAIDSGVPVGYHIAGEWVHLGGTHPTVSENIRRVVARMHQEEPIIDHI